MGDQYEPINPGGFPPPPPPPGDVPPPPAPGDNQYEVPAFGAKPAEPVPPPADTPGSQKSDFKSASEKKGKKGKKGKKKDENKTEEGETKSQKQTEENNANEEGKGDAVESDKMKKLTQRRVKFIKKVRIGVIVGTVAWVFYALALTIFGIVVVVVDVFGVFNVDMNLNEFLEKIAEPVDD